MWECHVYDHIGNIFMIELENLWGAHDNFNMAGFILGCENWDRYDFKVLLNWLCIVSLGYQIIW